MTAWAKKPRKPAPMDDILYFDYQASTPVDARVQAAMLPWLTSLWGNPHAQHSYGAAARDAVEKARAQVAAALGATANEIIFTSGATESNNLAIKGAAAFAQRHDVARRHVITVATEHKSVLQSCADMDVTVLPVDGNGLVDMPQLQAALRPDTLLVSVMAVNNETGVMQPLEEIGALCRANGSYFHSDAAQAVGRMELDVEAMQIDLLSLSGHKAYAPQGVGALFVRHKPRVRLEPLFSGGGQERGLRSGTVATPLVVALGEAVMLAEAEREVSQARMVELETLLLNVLQGSVRVHGVDAPRAHGCLNLGFEGADAAELRERLPQIACAGGSSCRSASGGASHVLGAMGIEGSGLRMGFGRFTTQQQVQKAAELLKAAIA